MEEIEIYLTNSLRPFLLKKQSLQSSLTDDLTFIKSDSKGINSLKFLKKWATVIPVAAMKMR
jgi:hypothetical protein